MKTSSHAPKFFLLLFMLVAGTGMIAAQSTATGAAPAQLIVTIEPHKGSTPPVINREDVMVYHEHNRLAVTGWESLEAAKTPVEFFILIDDALGASIAPQLNDVRSFIMAQAASTAIGVGYIHNGTVYILQKPTTDHAAAAKVLRTPLGNTSATSAYEALAGLLKQWPQSAAVHEVLMITNGVEPFGPLTASNPIVSEAIEAAQRAGVPVFAIYASGEGHLSHSFWRENWAQSYLSQVADETGSEAYNFINQNVNFAPYLNDISQRLHRQYRLTFVPEPMKKSGIERVRVTTEVPHVDLVAADGVWVEAAQ